MSDRARQLDPEIAEVLRDIARDPDAKLLTAPTLAEVPALVALRDPTPPSTRTLAKAERHLIQVYREEAAWLLRQASTIACMEHPQARVRTHVTVEQRLRPLEREVLRSRVGNVLTHASEALGGDDFVSALSELLECSAPPLGSGARLAAMSLRLFPSDEARLCLAYGLRQRHASTPAEPEQAMSILEDVKSHDPGSLNGAFARTNIAQMHFEGHAFLRARDEYRAGAAGAATPFALIRWLQMACQVGDRVDALDAAKTLDDLVAPEHPAIDECITLGRPEPFRRSSAYEITTRRCSTAEAPRRGEQSMSDLSMHMRALERRRILLAAFCCVFLGSVLMTARAQGGVLPPVVTKKTTKDAPGGARDPGVSPGP